MHMSKLKYLLSKTSHYMPTN